MGSPPTVTQASASGCARRHPPARAIRTLSPGMRKDGARAGETQSLHPSMGAPVPACPLSPGAPPVRSRTPPPSAVNAQHRRPRVGPQGRPGRGPPRGEPGLRVELGGGCCVTVGEPLPLSDAQVLSWWLHPTRMDSEPGIMTRRRGARQEAVWVLRTSLRPYAVPHLLGPGSLETPAPETCTCLPWGWAVMGAGLPGASSCLLTKCLLGSDNSNKTRAISVTRRGARVSVAHLSIQSAQGGARGPRRNPSRLLSHCLKAARGSYVFKAQGGIKIKGRIIFHDR